MAHKPAIKGNKGRIEDKRPCAQARPILGRKQNAKNEDLDSPTPQKVKNKHQKCIARPDKLIDNDKCMNDRQTMDSHGSRACIRLRHHSLVPSQYKRGEPWARGKRGYGLVVGKRGKSILGFPLKLFWRKCLAGMTYHLKEGEMSWNY